jgi:hypothetical protein
MLWNENPPREEQLRRRIDLGQRPDFGIAHEGWDESRRHHTDDLMRDVVQQHRSSNDARVAGEPGPPEGVAQQCDRRDARDVLGAQEAATE